MEIECDDGQLFFNTLTGAILLFEKKDNWSKEEDTLIKYRFLVSEKVDECSFVDEFHSFLNLIDTENKNKTVFTILTTTDCNARCFYCYEQGRKRMSMSVETAKAVASYISNVSKGDEVKLHWFGGEPLYNMKAIDMITSTLSKQGTGFSSRITTNGFYLGESVVKKAKNEWNTELVQITLDGTEHIYNKIKAYIDKTDTNPFITVMNNIEYALDEGIQVSLRLNMDKKNADNLFILCDELAERFGGKDNLKVYIALLRGFVGDIHSFSSEEETASCFLALQDKLEKFGLYSAGRLTRKIPSHKCMADSDSCEVILPDGKVGRCEHYSESEISGTIYDLTRDEDMVQSWREKAEPFDECRNCALYPRCFNLNKCDWNKDGCSLSHRIIKTEQLKKQILSEYHKWKQSNKS